MSIKSEKANREIDRLATNYIGNGGTLKECSELCDVVKQVVRFAESDARERAVRAFKMACTKYDDGREHCWLTSKPCNLQCQEGYDFLKHYDNER